ncbi:MAG: thymidine phosphorylase, partial [Actinomycetota bacterium]|nr:thymidine phosphorylase [Actinomycetota bacterium]
VPAAGVVLLAKPGDRLTAGQPLLELHAEDVNRFDRALDALAGAITVDADGAWSPPPLVLERIGA